MIALISRIRWHYFIFLFVIFIYGKIIFPFFQGKIYASYDLMAVEIPSRIFYSIALERNDDMGYWNPFLFRGFDHLGIADMGFFHPVHYVLYRFFPVHLGIAIEIALGIPFGFFGMMLLLRRVYRLSYEATFLGSGVFVFSSFFLAHFGQIHMVWIYAHQPWLLWCVERCFTGKKRCNRLLASGMLGFFYGSSLLLCHPQIVWIISLPTGAWIIYRIFSTTNRFRFLTIFIGLGSGLMIGMMQLIPTLASLSHADRGYLSEAQRSNFSLHPLHLLTNLSPYIFKEKTIGDKFYTASGKVFYLNNISEYSAYFGIALLTFIYCCFYRKYFLSKGMLGFWLSVSLLFLSLLLMMGKYGEIQHILGYFPLISHFRAPNRYKIILAFGFSILGALGMHFLGKEKKVVLGKKDILFLFIPFSLSMILFCLMLFFKTFSFRDQTITTGDWTSLIWGPIYSGTTIGLFLISLQGKVIQKKIARTLLGLICIVDLTGYGLPIVTGATYKTMDDIAQARKQMITQDKTFRRISLSNTPWWEGYYLANGYMGMKPKQYLDYSNYTHLRLASIQYAYVKEDQIVPVKDPLPRIRFASRLEHRKNSLQHTEDIAIEETVLCEPGIGTPLTGSPLSSKDHLDVLQDAFDFIQVRVSVSEPRVLVISDYWHQDWKVYKGKKVEDSLPLFSGALRGTLVYPQDNIVEFRYEPSYLTKAFLLCIIGSCISGGMILFSCKT